MNAQTARHPARWDLLALGVVVAVGLVARLVFAAGAPVFLEGDSQSYLLPGWELATGQGFSPELRRTPLYPLFVAASFRAFGQDLDALALAQHALGLMTVALTYLLGRLTFGRAAAVLASLAIAISGPQLIDERYLMTEALFGFILAAACLLMVASLQPASTRPLSPSPPLPALAGLAIALASLTRPIAQAILPLFLVALLLALPRWRPALKAVGFALAGYALLVAPWTARNLAAHETLTASGGLGRSLIARTVKYDNLFDWKWLSETYGGRDDLSARARMALYRKRGNIPDSRSVRPYQDSLIRDLGLSQGQADAMMRQIALEAIGRRPTDYVLGSLRFTGLLLLDTEERLQSHWKQRASKDWAEQWDDRLDFLVRPVAPWAVGETADPANQAAASSQAMLTALTALYQPARVGWLLVGLVLAGCWFAGRRTAARPALLLGLVALSTLALSAFLDGPVPRYRHPLEPLISVLAAGGLVGSGRLLRDLARRRAAVAAPTGGPALAPSRSSSGRAASAGRRADAGSGQPC